MAHSSLLNVDSAQRTDVDSIGGLRTININNFPPYTRSITHVSSSVVETDLAHGFKASSGAWPHTLRTSQWQEYG